MTLTLVPSALTPAENAEQAVALDPVRLYLESDERRAWQDFHKAMRLAPSLDVFEALLRGEKVPVSRLDPEWVKAYGRS